jgi:hypothetical protein
MGSSKTNGQRVCTLPSALSGSSLSFLLSSSFSLLPPFLFFSLNLTTLKVEKKNFETPPA